MNFAPDLVAIIHSAFVAFVIFGFVLVVAGVLFHWHWTQNLYFRAAHFLSIGFVALRTWLAVPCPLTALETHLRTAAKGESETSPLGQILHRYSFNSMNDRTFKIVVTVFALIVTLELVWTLIRRWRYHRRLAQA